MMPRTCRGEAQAPGRVHSQNTSTVPDTRAEHALIDIRGVLLGKPISEVAPSPINTTIRTCHQRDHTAQVEQTPLEGPNDAGSDTADLSVELPEATKHSRIHLASTVLDGDATHTETPHAGARARWARATTTG